MTKVEDLWDRARPSNSRTKLEKLRFKLSEFMKHDLKGRCFQMWTKNPQYL